MGMENRYRRWVVLGILVLLCMLLLALEMPFPQVAQVAQIPLSSSGAPLARAKSTSVRILPLGDSITYGHGSANKGGYRLPLWNDLQERGISIDFVGSQEVGPTSFDRDNEGLPGWKINQIASEVVGWLQTYQPQIILLHIGTNDFVKNDHPELATARLSHLIDLIMTTLPNAILIVAQIIPITRNAELNAEVINYNADIPGIVRAKVARGKHVQYVDMYHAVSPDMLPDQIHPNDAGYDQMAKVWLRALLPLLKPDKGSTRVIS